ncbi:ead/Ea22-like family protein [Serratia ureilytica]|uniref:ead/Ea22-like family protein n=1 Tax=Serratia ureilytica TaxID=300181 RepID=UPI002577F6A6|nr:ead/Ea22-like family protein [Serratia ureilytica]MDM1814904.1 ead/Ea22-like family protein [Serratia ureilytica]
MDKFSELKAAAIAATPGPWFRSSVQFNGITTEETFITQGNKPHVASTSEKRDAIFIAAANPAAVLELLAELEAKDKRIAELEASETQLIQERDSAEQALADMYEAATGERPEWSNLFGLSDAIEEVAQVRSKLATPVRLPKPCAFNLCDLVDRDAVIASLREQGFTVEGDE